MIITIRRGVQIVAGAAVFALALAACSSGSSKTSTPTSASGTAASSTGAATGSITVGGCQPQNPLVPGNTNETCASNVLDYVFTTLVRYNDDTGKPELAAAQSITTTDAQNFDIKLVPGMTFSDGTPVTAKSFVDAWNWVAYGPNGALDADPFFDPIQGFADVHPSPVGTATTAPTPKVKTMSGLKVISDTEFTIALTAPSSSFQASLGYLAFAPLPAAFYTNIKAFGRAPIGNGPFKVVSYVDNQDIKLTANTTYFDPTHAAKVKDVDYKIYQDEGAEYNDLLAGNVDFQQQVPTSALVGDKYKTDLSGRGENIPTLVFQTIDFPLYDPKFKNVDLRKAISLAIDRKTITSKIFNGTRTPATAYTVPSLPGYNAGACGTYCSYDPTAAKAELTKAGGFTGTLTLNYNADGDHKAWTTAVCNSIKNALGINCQATPTPTFAAFRTNITDHKETGMFRAGWQYDYPNIADGLEPLYGTGGGSNDTTYSNPTVDAAFKAASQLTDPTAAANAYGAAEALVLADMPSIPLWYSSQQFGWSDKVANVKCNVFGELDLTQITKK